MIPGAQHRAREMIDDRKKKRMYLSKAKAHQGISRKCEVQILIMCTRPNFTLENILGNTCAIAKAYFWHRPPRFLKSSHYSL